MFMNELKGLVTTLVSILIFISAVELVAPNNKMKKYIKFILGLILMTVILNPILEFVSKGQESFSKGISEYEQVFSQNQSKTNIDMTNALEGGNSENEAKQKAFMKNFNKNCDSLLHNQYKDMDFKSEIDCNVDFVNVSLNINKLSIGIADKKIKKIKKITIKETDNNSTKEENNEYEEIVKFISTELDIPKDKIEVYKLEE